MNTMKNLTIKVSDKDYDLLQRIADATDRRLSDLSHLIYGMGLRLYFCETLVSVEMQDDEMPQEKRDQLAKNAELEKQDGWYQLSYEERKKQGYAHVCTHMHNGDNQPGGDQLIEPLAERIKAEATK